MTGVAQAVPMPPTKFTALQTLSIITSWTEYLDETTEAEIIYHIKFDFSNISKNNLVY